MYVGRSAEAPETSKSRTKRVDWFSVHPRNAKPRFPPEVLQNYYLLLVPRYLTYVGGTLCTLADSE